MSQAELAAHVHSRLREEGIDVVLSGGAAVSIHTSNKYVSHDVDFVATGLASRAQIKRAMGRLGFQEVGRHYEHPDSKWFVEFPGGPPSVGMEPIKDIEEMRFATGTLRLLSATDCVKDRLSAYYHWHDGQSLRQACLLAANHAIDLVEVKRWSEVEGKLDEFAAIEDELLRGSPDGGTS
jgi:hypothetical protein